MFVESLTSEHSPPWIFVGLELLATLSSRDLAAVERIAIPCQVKFVCESVVCFASGSSAVFQHVSLAKPRFRSVPRIVTFMSVHVGSFFSFSPRYALLVRGDSNGNCRAGTGPHQVGAVSHPVPRASLDCDEASPGFPSPLQARDSPKRRGKDPNY